VRYAFIQTQERAHRVTRLCAALAVSRSGYYAWRDRPASARTVADQPLLPELCRLHQQGREEYGAMKLWHALRQSGVSCGRHRVVRLRKLAGLEARRIRRFRVSVERPRYETYDKDRIFGDLRSRVGLEPGLPGLYHPIRQLSVPTGQPHIDYLRVAQELPGDTDLRFHIRPP